MDRIPRRDCLTQASLQKKKRKARKLAQEFAGQRRLRAMLVELEKDAQQGQKNPVAVNADHVWNVTPGVQRGIGGQATTMITFINGQTITVIGEMGAVLSQLTGK